MEMLGALLQRSGVLDRDTLAAALDRQAVYGGWLDTALLEMGVMDESSMTLTLARWTGYPACTVAALEQPDRAAVAALPAALAAHHLVAPFRITDEALHVAATAPVDVEGLGRLGGLIGRAVLPYVATELRIRLALESIYGVPMDVRFLELSRKVAASTSSARLQPLSLEPLAPTLSEPPPDSSSPLVAALVSLSASEEDDTGAPPATADWNGPETVPPAAPSWQPPANPQESTPFPAPDQEAQAPGLGSAPPGYPPRGEETPALDQVLSSTLEAVGLAEEGSTPLSSMVAPPLTPPEPDLDALATGECGAPLGPNVHGWAPAPADLSPEDGQGGLAAVLEPTETHVGDIIIPTVPGAPDDLAPISTVSDMALEGAEVAPVPASAPTDPDEPRDPAAFALGVQGEVTASTSMQMPGLVLTTAAVLSEAHREPPAVPVPPPPPPLPPPPAVNPEQRARDTLPPLPTVSTPPPHGLRLASPVLDFRDAVTRLMECRDREAIVQVFLAYVLQAFPFAAVLGVVRGHAMVLAAQQGGRADPEQDDALRGFMVPLADVPDLRTVVETRAPAIARPLGSPACPSLAERLGRGEPRAVLLAPVLVGGRVAAVLYADHGEWAIRTQQASEALALSGRVGLAFERLIVDRRMRTPDTPSAPAQAPETAPGQEAPVEDAPLLPPGPGADLAPAESPGGGEAPEVDGHLDTPPPAPGPASAALLAEMDLVVPEPTASPVDQPAPALLASYAEETLPVAADGDTPGPLPAAPLDDTPPAVVPTHETPLPLGVPAFFPSVDVPPLPRDLAAPAPETLPDALEHPVPPPPPGGCVPLEVEPVPPLEHVPRDEPLPGDTVAQGTVEPGPTSTPAGPARDEDEDDDDEDATVEGEVPLQADDSWKLAMDAALGHVEAAPARDDDEGDDDDEDDDDEERPGETSLGADEAWSQAMAEALEQARGAVTATEEVAPAESELVGRTDAAVRGFGGIGEGADVGAFAQALAETIESGRQGGEARDPAYKPFAQPSPPLPAPSPAPPLAPPPLPPEARAPGPAPSAPPPPLPEDAAEPPAEPEDLVRQLSDPDPARVTRAADELVALGRLSVAALTSAFPGRVSFDPFGPDPRPPEPARVSALLGVVSRLGPLGQPVAVSHVASSFAAHRYFATLVLCRTFEPSSIPHLLRRLNDDEPRIRKLSADGLLQYTRHPAFEQVLRHLRTRVTSLVPEARRRAIYFLAHFRDESSIPAFIAALRAKESDVVDEAGLALQTLTLQSIGPSEKKWLSWWERNRERHRVEWLMDALRDSDAEMRERALAELVTLSQDTFGFNPEGSRREREEAAKRWDAWWQRERGRLTAPPVA
jgi:hypothetical protein